MKDRSDDSEFMHIAYTEKELNLIFERTKKNMKIYTLVRFLYETISRLQDAFGLKKQQFIDHFDNSPNKDYEFTIPGKKSSARKAKIEPELMKLIVRYA